MAIEQLNPTPYSKPKPTPVVIHENTTASGVHSSTVRIEEATRIDEVDANTLYVGYAEYGTLSSSAKWKIKKVTTVGTETKIEYANGNLLYDNVWDDRVTLNYS